MIRPVIEGHGEVEAFPTLLRRLIPELGTYIGVRRPQFCPKNLMTANESEFKRQIQLARLEPNVTAVLFLFDADDDCAQKSVPVMRAWAHEVAPDFPCGIVMARREYEAWFLASLESLQGVRNIPQNAHYDGGFEDKRDAKGVLRRLSGYSPKTDQAALSAVCDLQLAYKNASSFRKLVRELVRLLAELGHVPVIPESWEEA